MDVPMSWMKEYAPVTADIKDFVEDITLRCKSADIRIDI